MTLRVYVVDDEPLARELLGGMLASHDDVVVVGEAGDGQSAVEGIAEWAPDLVFLDVQMPEKDGFEVLRGLAGEHVPAVVFVTAFDRYAMAAFEVAALDYLLKPFDEERLARTLDLARRRLLAADRDTAAERRRLLELLESLRPEPRPKLDRIPLRLGSRTLLQPTDGVRWIEAQGKLVRYHVDGGVHEVRDSLLRLESSLDGGRFVRVSRFAIVNLDRLREVHPWFHGDHVLVLDDGTRLTSTRRYREQLARLMDG